MFVFDALGEIRLTHGMDLIDEILDGGTHAIAVTVCDPKTYGETAFDEALRAILDYDRHIDSHRDRLTKATAIEHARRAHRDNRLGICDRDHRVIVDDPEEIRILQEEEGPQFQPEHWPLYIRELNGPRRMEVVLQGLEQRGYRGGDLEKLAGGNLDRLYSEVVG